MNILEDIATECNASRNSLTSTGRRRKWLQARRSLSLADSLRQKTNGILLVIAANATSLPFLPASMKQRRSESLSFSIANRMSELTFNARWTDGSTRREEHTSRRKRTGRNPWRTITLKLKNACGACRRASGQLEAEVVGILRGGAGADLPVYVDFKFAVAERELAGKGSGRRAIGKEDYQANGVMYLAPPA